MTLARHPDELSLLGGPLHRLGCRLGLVRHGTDTVRLGLALGVLPWVLVVALALLEGGGREIFSLSFLAGHLRLLVVIPLLFVCETLFDSKLGGFARALVASGVVPVDARDAFQHRIDAIRRWREAWLPELLCLVAAIALPWLGSGLEGFGTTAVYDPSRAVAGRTWTSYVYWTGALTLFRFLLLRWIYRLGLWWHFLWRLSRLHLHLVPVHPDRAAGLGFLEVVQTPFVWLVAAISVVQAGSLAEGLSTGRVGFVEIYPRFAVVLVVGAALVVGPLLLFTAKLWACKIKGLNDYMAFASHYVDGFDRKWLGAQDPGEQLLGTADIQSLADLANSIAVVRGMHLTPVSASLLTSLVAAALVPMLPLLLFEYPLTELLQKLFSSLAGF